MDNVNAPKKKRRKIQECVFWKPRGKKTHYCTLDVADPIKRCYGVCKHFSSLVN